MDDLLIRKSFADRGFAVVTTASACPDGNYYAFETGATGATITAIDFGEHSSLYNKHDALTGFEFVVGKVYYIKFRSITISAGTIICYNE